jgi:hypothetical protein
MTAPLAAWRAAGALLFSLGAAQMELGEYASARRSLEAALECDVIDPREVLLPLAEVYRRLGDDTVAEEIRTEHLILVGTLAEVANRSMTDESAPSPWRSWSAVIDGRVMNLNLSGEVGRAEIDLRDPEWAQGKGALHCVASRGEGHTLRRLIKQGEDPNAVWRNVTALHLVLICNRLDLAQMLIAAGVAIDGRFMPLLSCVRSVLGVQLLRAVNAPLEATDDKGRTPLIVATDLGKVDVAIALLKEGAAVAAVDSAGRTARSIAEGSNNPLHYAPLLSFIRAGG